MNNIASIRKDYQLQRLDETSINDHPLTQFNKWWQDAIDSRIEEVNAMTLATAGTDGRPSARIVLLKGVNDDGFLFFTNYNSNKGKNLEENPHAALVFFWKELERQIRIEGSVDKIDEKDSDEYFASRPQGSQLGAWASPQSEVISSRQILEKNVEQTLNKFAGVSIPRPGNWGGYILKPVSIEFWQGRSNRLHDRIRYSLTQNGEWKMERLAP